jgi:hypothetical protein
VNAVPFAGKKKGADSGIDGLIYFKPEGKTTEKAIVSVKGGENVNVAIVRDLGHVVDREKAKIGVFITLADSTGPMAYRSGEDGILRNAVWQVPENSDPHDWRVVRGKAAEHTAGRFFIVQESRQGKGWGSG